MTTTNAQEFRNIPVAALTFSVTRAQTERRQSFDKSAMRELAESIKSHGVMQPILVRPFRDENVKGEAFEVVAGERRALASKIAGREDIPATIRELTDEQVLELQLIENLQRQDLHELAEAEGYESLQNLGHSVDDMAAKVGKSKGTIYARMKLLALTPEGRKAFYAGKLSASTALYLARIPAELQNKGLKEITREEYSHHEGGKVPMSARAAQRHIHDNYMLRLADAGFKTEDADLVPAAGPCGTCPKRTGNQPELFGDVKGADVCTDPICFKRKLAAHAERAIAAAEASGQTVIQGPSAKKVFPYQHSDHVAAGFVALDDRDYERKGTIRQTLGKAYVPTLVVNPHTGKLAEVARQADVDKAHGEKVAKSKGPSPQRAEQKKREFELAYRRALFLAIHAKKADEERPTLYAACIEFFKSLSADAQQLMAKALEWDVKNTKGAHGSYSRHIEPKPFIDPMTLPELYKLLRALTMADELGFFTYGGKSTPRMDAAAKACGVSPAKVRSELQAAAKTKGPAKKPAAAKAPKKAPAKPRAKK